MITDKLHQAAVAASQSTAASTGATIQTVRSPSTVTNYLQAQVTAGTTFQPPCIVAIDLAQVANRLFKLRHLLPGVHIHYAIKCFPDPVILSMLAHLGASFDCASGAELSLAQTVLTAAGHDSDAVAARTIFANPVKSPADLAFAHSLGAHLVTFDSMEELAKFTDGLPHAQAVLRIATDDHTSLMSLSDKFGARPHEISRILHTAVRLGVNVVGVAFHVGYGARSLVPFENALSSARDVFRQAEAHGFCMRILDIGGGFPGCREQTSLSMDDICACIRHGLREFGTDVRVIAEPGQYMVHAATSMAIRVEHVGLRDGVRAYCVGDSIYGAFRGAQVLGERCDPKVLSCASRNREESRCDLLGITMEDLDVVCPNVSLPALEKGDWIVIHNKGGYAESLRSRRSDVPKPSIKYVFCEESMR